jgi:muramidase (phage lysozyme)
MTKKIDQLTQYLDNPNVRAILDLVANTEGTDKAHGYNTLVGGKKINDLSKHPNVVGLKTKDGASTASGRYQITGTTFRGLVKQYGFSDFSPQTQDLAAIALLKEKGALNDILTGKFTSALGKIKDTWVSLPNSTTKNQREVSTNYVRDFLAKKGIEDNSPVETNTNTFSEAAQREGARDYAKFRAGKMSDYERNVYLDDAQNGYVYVPPSAKLPAPPAGAFDFADEKNIYLPEKAPEPQKETGILEGVGNFFGGIAEQITGNERETKETQTLPDWMLMPEVNDFTSLAGLKTMGGAMISAPEEAVKIIKSNNPNVVVQKDSKGNYLLKSPQDGKWYAIKPGFRMSDLPRTLLPAAAAVATGGTSTVLGAVAAGAATQTAIEGVQAATGGDFNIGDVLLSGAAGGVGQGVANVLGRAKTGAPKLLQQIETPPPPAAQLTGTELGDVAREASTSVFNRSNAQKILAGQAAPDDEILAAADNLGVSQYLQPDHVTTNQVYRELSQAIKSIPASEARALEIKGLQQVASRADDIITDLGGDDLSAVGLGVKSAMKETQGKLEAKADVLYDKLRESIPAKSEVKASNVLRFIKKRADELGGTANLSPMEASILNKLSPAALPPSQTRVGIKASREAEKAAQKAEKQAFKAEEAVKAAELMQSVKAAEATKAAKAAQKAAQAVKATEAVKAKEVIKAAKAVKAVDAAQATKQAAQQAAKAVEATKAVKTAKTAQQSAQKAAVAAEAMKASKAAEVVKAAEAVKAARALKSVDATEAAKAAKALKSAEAAEAAKAVKAAQQSAQQAARALKSAEAAKVQQAAKAVRAKETMKAAKAAKVAKAAELAKAAKAAKVAKAAEAAGVLKATKAAEAAKAAKALAAAKATQQSTKKAVEAAKALKEAKASEAVKAAQQSTKRATPTYALLDDLRRDLVAARYKKQGVFKDSDVGLIKKLESELMKDQRAAASKYKMLSTLKTAQKTVSVRKSLEDDMVFLFGDELDKSFVGLLSSATKALPAGDAEKFTKLLKAIPADQKQSVVAGALQTAFGKSAKRGDLDFTSYVNWYSGVMRNKESAKAIMGNLDYETRQALNDLYKVSKGISLATKERITTGRVQAVKDQLRDPDKLLLKIYDGVRRAAVGYVTNAIAPSGSGIAAGLSSILSKDKTATLKAADALLASEEFKDLISSVAKGTTSNQKIKKLSITKKFINYLKAIGEPLDPKSRYRYLAALVASSSTKIGNEENANSN